MKNQIGPQNMEILSISSSAPFLHQNSHFKATLAFSDIRVNSSKSVLLKIPFLDSTVSYCSFDFKKDY